MVQRTFHVGRCFVRSFWMVQPLIQRYDLSIIVKYFYVSPCVSRFIFTPLQLMVYCAVIFLELPLKVMLIGRQCHVVFVHLIK